MKNLITILLVVFFYPLSLYASPQDKEIGLYTKEEYVLQPINRISDILKRFQEDDPNTNVLLYVHGRGKDTHEEWQDLAKLEELYGVRIVMFHWPSWTSLLNRPVQNAKNSADELSEVFQEIKAYKEENSEVFSNKKFTLLVHSMGHIILREFIEKYYSHDLNDPNGKKLFDNYVSTGADIGLTDHRAWISNIDFAARKYITMNNRDLVLTLSYFLDLKAKIPYFYKLGLGFLLLPIKKKTIHKMLDEKSSYIDLSTPLEREHRYFQVKQPVVRKIFNSIINGEMFDAKKLNINVAVDQNIVYVKQK